MSDVVTMRGAKNLSVSMRLMREVTQVEVAKAIELSDSALGDWIAKGHLQRACAVIAASGGKVVDQTEQTIDQKTLEAMLHMTQLGAKSLAEQHSGFGADDL